MRRSSDSSSRGNGHAARARGARLVIGLVFGVLLLRLVELQVVEHARYADLARDNILREEVVPAVRGVIRDRQGRILVDSVPSFTVAIDPHDVAFRRPDSTSIAEVLELLGPLVGASTDSMLAKIEAERRRSYRPVRLKRHLTDSMVVYIQERRDRLAGVVIEEEPMRRYVHGELAAHVLGYVGEVSAAEIGPTSGADDGTEGDARVYRAGDLIGRTGIERRFEGELGGHNGRRMVEVSALGRRNESRLGLPRYGGFEAPTNGADLDLTIDLEVQRTAEEVFPADHAGALVVLDVADGGVIAILSRPAFDPNAFARGLSAAEWRSLNSDPRHPQHNRALMSGYPPGSVFKPVTALAALGAGGVGAKSFAVDCEGGWQFGNRWFGCHHVHGRVTFESAMVLSCDTYFYQAGLRTGLDAIADEAIALGFGKRCGIELSEGKGFVPSVGWYNDRYGKRGWTQGVVLNLSIGQGEILATPLQMASMMATLANRGRPVRPHLVRAIGGVGRQNEALPQTVDADASTMTTLLRALERVVSDPRGTGRRARVEGVRLAGKTGTAQNPHGEDHALFAGFAPCDAPRIAFAVVVENAGHGGEMAAPVAAAVVRACLQGERTHRLAGEAALPLAGPGD